MRWVGALVLLAASGATAGDPSPGPRVDAVVPVPPFEHERLHYFGRRHHHLVPGTVTIDRPPYVCDLDHQTFGDQDTFVAHLRGAHHARPESIPDALVVVEGQVHFLAQ